MYEKDDFGISKSFSLVSMELKSDSLEDKRSVSSNIYY